MFNRTKIKFLMEIEMKIVKFTRYNVNSNTHVYGIGTMSPKGSFDHLLISPNETT